MEFVQFHPTVLFSGGVPRGQLPLVSEAVRGEGAVLIDQAGTAFMAGRHPLADLAPRDIVAREIDAVMRRDGTSNVWLDATGIAADILRARFPTVLAACSRAGIDPISEPIPVAPAEHFLCGGVRTDRWGATDVAGLYAVGEVASTGVHGANRLASNSLLEGLVFGRRVAARLVLELPAAVAAEPETGVVTAEDADPDAVRAILSEYAGVRRSGAGLHHAAADLATVGSPAVGNPAVGNPALAIVAGSVIAAAMARRESRGCHWRSDFPKTNEAWAHRVVIRLDESGRPAAFVERLQSVA